MTAEELVHAFLEAARRKGRAPTTLAEYARHLGRFLSFSELEGLSPTSWRPVHLARFARSLSAAGESPGKLYGTLYRVAAWLRWAFRQNLVLVDVARDVRLRAPAPEPQRVLTVEEVKALLAACDGTTVLGLRDRALVETLYGTGLRRRELLSLNLDDLDRARQGLVVRRGKGAKDRFQPIGDRLAELLERYVDEGRPGLSPAPDERGLFLGVHGRRLIQERGILQRLARRAGVPAAGCHAFRRAFASHLLAGGASLLEVKALLGHRVLAATAIYVDVPDAEMVRVYRQTHPRARRRSRRS